MERSLSLRQAAQKLGVDIADVWQAAQEGSLEGHRVEVGGRRVWRFSSAAVTAWMQSTADRPAGEPAPTETGPAEPAAPETGNTTEHRLLEMLDRSQQELLRLQRQLLAAHQAASQGQRLLSEHAESQQRDRALLLQEQSRAEELASELKVARAELADWHERRNRPWWKKLIGGF